jgi:hypothetical protein
MESFNTFSTKPSCRSRTGGRKNGGPVKGASTGIYPHLEGAVAVGRVPPEASAWPRAGADRIVCVGWGIARGPREFDRLKGFDIDVGWAYYLERGEDERTVSMPAVAGALHANDLPMEAQRAIETRGRTAVEAVLGEDEPARYLVVSSTGAGPSKRAY